MTNTYYAAVDKDGKKTIFFCMPHRVGMGPNGTFWIGGKYEIDAQDIKSFPNITWEDEPVKVELSIKVVHD